MNEHIKVYLEVGVPGLKELEPELRLVEGPHPPDEADDPQTLGQLDGRLETGQELVQHPKRRGVNIIHHRSERNYSMIFGKLSLLVSNTKGEIVKYKERTLCCGNIWVKIKLLICMNI